MIRDKKQPIFLLGAGGHARSCIDVIEATNDFEICGLIGLEEETGSSNFGYQIVGGDQSIDRVFREANASALGVVSLGQIKSPKSRISLFNKLEKIGKVAPAIVSPYAHVSKRSRLGVGTIIFHGSIINAGVTVGENCIINSHSLIEHDSLISSHCHISTGVKINGGVTVGTGTFIGSGCVVKEGVNIGEGCVIGMGQTLLNDVEPGSFISAKRGK
jgi:sugar O-acyltransferase (sialic acid O-acetyltransferase NeuD family)